MTTGDWDDLDEAIDDGQQVADLKRQLSNVSRQLYQVKHKRADYLEAVRQATLDAIARIEVKPVKAPARGKIAPGREEHAVPLFSDTQTGKITPDYNSDVAAERVDRYADKIVELSDIHRAGRPVNHCVVPMLGDIVEGVDIFPGQQWLIDSTLYEQIFNTSPTMIVDFVRKLLAKFDTVTIEAVQGNHGRLGRKGMFGPEDNADRMVYRVVKMLLRDEPRFTMNMADPKGEAAWYKIMTIGNYRALLIHGDQIRGHSGFPWYGLGKKVNGWGSGGLGADSDFNDVMMGHYHQLGRIPLNQKNVWANGSTESYNTFAMENLAAQSEPMQWLLFVDGEKGRVTASYGVDLR